LLRKIFSREKKERIVISKIKEHIRLLVMACEKFHDGLLNKDNIPVRYAVNLEREGDAVRREIIARIHEGAFLPYLRPDLCRFVEIVDRVFDAIEDTANRYLEIEIPDMVRDDCTQVALLNVRICEMLMISLDAMLQGEDLRKKMLAIRIYEKKIDDIKFHLRRKVRKIPIGDFWEGRLMSEFFSGLTSISDFVEDASDYLSIINVSMR
jgi:predicted phosphate transport protein (TIGR00153 family)